MTAQPNDTPAGDEGATLTEVLTMYSERGFDITFSVLEDGHLECGDCRAAVDPHTVSMSSLRRLEGASDPADMLAIVALACPICDRRGTVTLGYGPAGSPEDGDVLRAFRDRRGDSDLPRSSAPGETTGDR